MSKGRRNGYGGSTSICRLVLLCRSERRVESTVQPPEGRLGSTEVEVLAPAESVLDVATACYRGRITDEESRLFCM